MKEIVKLIRVRQWVKNVFVFVPLFFGGELSNMELVTQSIIAFFIFSFTASAVYVLNDYVDIEQDQLHPEKKKRPLASGAISKSQAVIIFIGLLLLAILGILYLDNWKVGAIILFYFVMNVAYSFKLKHIAIIDVLIISIGFLLRVFVGGYATGITVSPWTQVLVFCLALIMAFGKRRGELVNAELTGKTRKALEGYNLEFANYSLVVASTITIVSYLMFCLSPSTLSHFHHYIFYTFIFVIAGVLRYLQQTFVYNQTESPTKMVFKDHFLQVVVFLFLVSFAFLIYFR